MTRPKRHNNGSIMRKLKEHNARMVEEAEKERKRREQEGEKPSVPPDA